MTGTANAGTPSLHTLAAFSHDWVGGNIAGLASFASTLAGYVSPVGDVVTALDRQVATIVNDAGWQGQAASAFSRAWQSDAVGATALATVITSTAENCNWLASKLSIIENALEKVAQEVAAHGVQIGPDGQPVPEPLTEPAASWRQAYLSFWNLCMTDAAQARATAATAMQGIYAKCGPPPHQSGGSGGLQPGDYNTLGDYLRGFWALPTISRKALTESVDTQEALVSQAAKDLRTLKKEFGNPSGSTMREALENWEKSNAELTKGNATLTNAKDELAGLQDELTAAESNESAFTKALDFSVHDIPAFSGDDLSGVLKVAADTPFVDIASAGLGTYLNAEQDIHQGVSPYVAVPGEAAGSAASIAGASAVAEALGETAAPLAVDLGVAGIAAWGIGDVVHNAIDEPWGSDINNVQYVNIGPGVNMQNPFAPIDGLVIGVGNVLDHTATDGVTLVKDTGLTIAEAGEKTWQGLDSAYHNIFNPTTWLDP
jgi:uncharacterized protein YukE